MSDIAAALASPETLPPAGLVAAPRDRGRLVRFAIIGSLGLVWDTATTYAARPLLGLLPATLLAFVVAATLNWAANRLWTFRDRRCGGSLLRQWALYMVANSLGFLLNRGTVVGLVLVSPFCRAEPVLALAAGAIAGLGANWSLAHRVVFRARPVAQPG